jgi:predicted enzyme related to lactoylglutathione lyase
MPRPIHFDISADDPERAVAFYGNVFGWKFDKWDGPMEYWMVQTGENGEPGIDGGLSRRSENSGPVMNTIGVPDADVYVAKITGQGGTIVMPKSAIPGVGWFVAATDTEGNAFGLMQSDPNAA